MNIRYASKSFPNCVRDARRTWATAIGFVLALALSACDPGGMMLELPGNGGGEAPDDGPVGRWVWHEVAGAVCANGTPTGIGVNQGLEDRVVVYMSGGSPCLNEGCTVGTPSMRRDGGFGAAELEACVAGRCDGGVVFPTASIFDRDAATNPFSGATYVFIPNCTGDYYVGDTEHEFRGWTAHFRGWRNQGLFTSELAASFPETSRVILTGGSAGSVGAMLNYWRWVEAFPASRVDLVSDSFAMVSDDGPQWRYDLHNPQAPPGCATCATDYRTIYGFNANLAPDSRIAVIDSENNWTLDLATGYTYTQGLEALQPTLDELPNLKYHVANGSTHVLLQHPMNSNSVDSVTQVCRDGRRVNVRRDLSEFLAAMQDDDLEWQSFSCLPRNPPACEGP